MWCWSGGGRILRKLSLYHVLCTIIMVHKLTGRLTVSGFDLAWFCSLSSKRLCVFGLNIQILNFFCLHPSLYLLVSWAWYDWALMWLTDQLEINMHHLQPAPLWHCVTLALFIIPPEGNAIPAGHVQYPLSDCDKILCRWGIPSVSQVRSNFNIIGTQFRLI